MRTFYLSLLCIVYTAFGFSADYYWIGGTGNWSDISHWAASSGSTVTYSAAPTAEDNVIFDTNSFTGPNQTITINTEIAFFKSMNWTGLTNNPTFLGPRNAILNVFGELTLSPDMNFNCQGKNLFIGDGDNKSIDYAAH